MLIRIKALGPNLGPCTFAARADMRQSACRAGVDDHAPGLEATTDIPAKADLIAFRGRPAGFRISAWTGPAPVVPWSISGLCSLA